MENKRMLLGVAGGLGPLATAYFMELLTVVTDAATDQEHIDTLVYSRPDTPDRTAFLLGESNASPIPMLIDTLKLLTRFGCDRIAMPCVTAHGYHNTLQSSIPVRIINIVEETTLALEKQGVKKAGILATSGTLKTRIFASMLEKHGIEPLAPEGELQRLVMHVIYDCVKTGLPIDMDAFRKVSDSLRDRGAERLILGCTELSLAKRDCHIGEGYIDAMEALAVSSVLECGGKIKERFLPLDTIDLKNK